MVNSDSVLELVRSGFAVFPVHYPLKSGGCSCERSSCEHVGKHPQTPHGFKDASKDPDRISEWWSWDSPNVGIATGAVSGVGILDVDGKKGADELAKLEAEHGPLPRTPVARTGRDEFSRHVYFKDREDAPFPSKTAIRPGLDLRGDGGYVVAPPSLHASGRRYEWDVSPEEAPFAHAPDWLISLIKKPKQSTGSADLPKLAPANSPAEWSSSYVRAAVDGVVNDMRSAGEGTRNDTLNKCAFRLASLRAGGADVTDSAVAALAEAARAAGLEDAEIERTIRSGAQAGAQEPAVPDKSHEEVNLQRAIDKWHASSPSSTGTTRDSAREKGAEIRLTDLGNARRLVRRHGRDLRHSEAFGWLVWDGTRWAPDATGEVMRRASTVAEELFAEAQKLTEEVAHAPTKDEKKAAARRAEETLSWAIKSESERAIKAAVALARTEAGVAIRSDDLDRDPMLLNVANGTIDLRTGTLREHRREDYLTKLAPVTYDPDARSEMWEQFLGRITLGDESLVAFLRRAAGYALTGDVTEQCFLLAYGVGSNGKSTFIETVRTVMGDYSIQAQFSTFTSRKDNGGARGDIARLRGARLVSAIEGNEHSRLDESLVKQLTGGDTVTARMLYKDEFEFRPAFKLFLATNHKPRISGTDHGIWRRIRLVPFLAKFEGKDKDPKFKERLLETELPGVLAWAVRGCLEWRRDGLGEPDAVTAATNGYRSDQDDLGRFLEERCLVQAGARVASGILYSAFTTWSTGNGEKPLSQKSFTSRMQDRGFVKARNRHRIEWHGVTLPGLNGDDTTPSGVGSDPPPGESIGAECPKNDQGGHNDPTPRVGSDHDPTRCSKSFDDNTIEAIGNVSGVGCVGRTDNFPHTLAHQEKVPENPTPPYTLHADKRDAARNESMDEGPRGRVLM